MVRGNAGDALGVGQQPLSGRIRRGTGLGDAEEQQCLTLGLSDQLDGLFGAGPQRPSLQQGSLVSSASSGNVCYPGREGGVCDGA